MFDVIVPLTCHAGAFLSADSNGKNCNEDAFNIQVSPWVARNLYDGTTSDKNAENALAPDKQYKPQRAVSMPVLKSGLQSDSRLHSVHRLSLKSGLAVIKNQLSPLAKRGQL